MRSRWYYCVLPRVIDYYLTIIVKLRAANLLSVDEPSANPQVRLRQLCTITAAYRSLTVVEPLLPLPESPLPALLALRNTLNLIDQDKASISETRESIITAKQRLQQEEADLRDARSMNKVLRKG